MPACAPSALQHQAPDRKQGATGTRVKHHLPKESIDVFLRSRRNLTNICSNLAIGQHVISRRFSTESFQANHVASPPALLDRNAVPTKPSSVLLQANEYLGCQD